MNNRSARGLYVVAVAAWIGVSLWAYGQLPERAATHFGPSGAADGFMTRQQNLWFSLLLGVLILFGLPLLSWLLMRGDGRLINLPTQQAKDYWTAPQRIDEFRRVAMHQLLVFSAVTMVLLLTVEVAIVFANRHHPPALGAEVWVALLGYLAFTFWWARTLSRRFRVPDDAPG